MAACAAHKQGKFEEMSDGIWKATEERDLTDERMGAIAQEIGLDMNKYQADVKGQDCQSWIQQSQETLTQFGATGTPAFFINGRFMSGSQPLPAFDKIIQEELEKAKQSKVAAGEYYEKVVFAQGLKELKEDE
jgi:predicted DsbA family dithiol-disulfide isomerase